MTDGNDRRPELRAHQQYHKDADQLLVDLVPDDWEAGNPVHRVVRQGTPFVRIIEYAREASIDLIVLGTHGRGALAQTLFGSVAEKVVRKAPCPVLSVRPEGHQFVMP